MIFRFFFLLLLLACTYINKVGEPEDDPPPPPPEEKSFYNCIYWDRRTGVSPQKFVPGYCKIKYISGDWSLSDIYEGEATLDIYQGGKITKGDQVIHLISDRDYGFPFGWMGGSTISWTYLYENDIKINEIINNDHGATRYSEYIHYFAFGKNNSDGSFFSSGDYVEAYITNE